MSINKHELQFFKLNYILRKNQSFVIKKEIWKLLHCTQNGESNPPGLTHCCHLMGQQNIRNCKLAGFLPVSGGPWMDLASHHTEWGPPLSFWGDSRELLNSAGSERPLAVKHFFCASEVGSFVPTALPLFPRAQSEVCYAAPIPVLQTMAKFGLTAPGKPMSLTFSRIFWPMLQSLNLRTYFWKRQNPHWRSQQ